jgi:ribonuclease HI
MSQNLILTTDGSCSFYRMRGGYVVRDADSGEIVQTGSKNFGRGTSNVAEYMALIAGCVALRCYDFESVVVYTDSQLVVRQLKGEYRVRSWKLRKLHDSAARQLRNLQAKLIWHRRTEGDGPLADALASGRSQEVSDEHDNQLDQRRHRAETPG